MHIDKFKGWNAILWHKESGHTISIKADSNEFLLQDSQGHVVADSRRLSYLLTKFETEYNAPKKRAPK